MIFFGSFYFYSIWVTIFKIAKEMSYLYIALWFIKGCICTFQYEELTRTNMCTSWSINNIYDFNSHLCHQIPSSNIFSFASIIKDAFISWFSIAFRLLIARKSVVASFQCHKQILQSSFFFVTANRHEKYSNTIFPFTE